MNQPYDIPPPPAPIPMVTVPQSLFERMASVYYGLQTAPAKPEQPPPVDRPQEGPTVFDPEAVMVYPDVHPSWRPAGRNAPKPPPAPAPARGVKAVSDA